MSGELRIALLQLAGSGYDREASLERGVGACRRAAAAGADVALFPELWSTGYSFSDGDLHRWRAQAIGRDDPAGRARRPRRGPRHGDRGDVSGADRRGAA